jgi:hypothetical protein
MNWRANGMLNLSYVGAVACLIIRLGRDVFYYCKWLSVMCQGWPSSTHWRATQFIKDCLRTALVCQFTERRQGWWNLIKYKAVIYKHIRFLLFINLLTLEFGI